MDSPVVPRHPPSRWCLNILFIYIYSLLFGDTLHLRPHRKIQILLSPSKCQRVTKEYHSSSSINIERVNGVFAPNHTVNPFAGARGGLWCLTKIEFDRRGPISLLLNYFLLQIESVNGLSTDIDNIIRCWLHALDTIGNYLQQLLAHHFTLVTSYLNVVFEKEVISH